MAILDVTDRAHMARSPRRRVSPAALILAAYCIAVCAGVLVTSAAGAGPVYACGDGAGAAASSYGFCNRTMSAVDRAADLVARLTLAEKVGFLVNGAAAVPRLGMPAYQWWSEALHGVSYVGPGTRFAGGVVTAATSFPQPLLTAASFNASLFKAIGQVVSNEARAMYNVGQAGLTFWSPNVNIFRDPRWGRGQETPGEDPTLVSSYAVNYVKGLQETSDYPNKLKVAACCKHYTAYDVDNWKGTVRETFNAVVSKQDLDDTFQPPFKSCVTDADVASVMCSYNKVNGVPTCADKDLLSGVIRGDWKLNGYIVSDCDSVDVLYNRQHYTKTPEEATAITIKAGLDLNCGSFLAEHALAALNASLLKEADIDNAITNNLVVLMRLGFFDGDPSQLPYGNLGPKDVCTAANQELAREAARQGIVLLKNSNGTLPLSAKGIKSMAVIGPNANASYTMIGNYEGTPCNYITPLQGLSAIVSTVYQAGCPNVACNSLQLDGATKAASQADVTVLIVGEDQSLSRESFDRTSLLLAGQQTKLITEVAKASKGPVIMVILSGGPFDITFAKNSDLIGAILWAGYPGEAGGGALADILFGYHNPGGRLPMTWYPESYAQTVAMTDMRMRPDPATKFPGRTYRFYKGDTVYSYGDGLSYTEYDHHLIQAPGHIAIPLDEGHVCRSAQCKSVDVPSGGKCDDLVFDIHVRVRNNGAMRGSHTVFLFVTPPAVHGAPQKQLVGFEKVGVEGGGVSEVVLRVDVCRDLSIVDEEGNRKVALGPHTLHVGSLKHSLTLKV